MKHFWRYQILLLLTLLITPSVLVFARDIALFDTVSGRILLDVENHGEAWYVYPPTSERYYLGRPDDAFRLMEELGLGISEVNFERVQADSVFRFEFAGRILLQVESRGEAWYIDPVSNELFFLGRPEDAYRLMYEQSLGIVEMHLEQIPIALELMPGVFHQVPFTAQAPLAEWNDLRQQEGCEEASVLMAMAWVRNQSSIIPDIAKQEILAMSDFQERLWGEYVDTSALDTYNRLFKAYFNYSNVEYRENITTNDIKVALSEGHIVLVTIDGKAINNPYFLNGGPERHMIVVTGYDQLRAEFITNEPGTKRGHNYRYSQAVLERSLRDYPSGRYVPIPEDAKTAMLIVKK